MSEPLVCGNCRCWDQYDDENGKCRSKPPIVALVPIEDNDMMANTYWPETNGKRDWCDQHELHPDLIIADEPK